MTTEGSIVAITALFIVGMTWLRARMQYVRRGAGPLQLESAGRVYFACVIASLGIGWFVAPALGRALWSEPAVTATLTRVVWCLSTYFISIVIHRFLRARGITLYRHRELPAS